MGDREVRRAHAQWLWGVLQGEAGEITEDDMDVHFGPTARTSPFFRSVDTLLRSASLSVARGAALLGTREDGGHIVNECVTPSGLRVDQTISFEPDGRILHAAYPLVGLGSSTSVSSAALRAAHRAHDPVRVLDDPFAEQLAGEVARGAMAGVAANPSASTTRWLMVIRSRFAEDTMEASSRSDGVDQCVLLGAGMDSFGLRHGLDGLDVFEVDLPASQSWKRKRLQELGVTIPESLHFAPCDFERDDLFERLIDVGFDVHRPAVVFWLGVVWYLTQDAIDGTLERLGSWPRRTTVVFDHVVPRSHWGEAGPERRALAESLERSTTLSGEPWLSFHDARAVHQMLTTHGFDHVETFDFQAMETMYLEPPHVPAMYPCFGLARGVRTR